MVLVSLCCYIFMMKFTQQVSQCFSFFVLLQFKKKRQIDLFLFQFLCVVTLRFHQFLIASRIVLVSLCCYLKPREIMKIVTEVLVSLCCYVIGICILTPWLCFSFFVLLHGILTLEKVQIYSSFSFFVLLQVFAMLRVSGSLGFQFLCVVTRRLYNLSHL